VLEWGLLLGLSQCAVMFCHLQIVVSNVGWGLNCCEVTKLRLQVAVMRCLFQCIQHDISP
jgi:hypothetical protein